MKENLNQRLASCISKKIYDVFDNAKNIVEYNINVNGGQNNIPQIKYTIMENIIPPRNDFTNEGVTIC